MRTSEALLVLFLAVAPAPVVSVAQTTAPEACYTAYCNGWREGWVAGWCYGRGDWCYPPMTPTCPSDPTYRSTWEDGFGDGFERGRKDRDGK
jgi:hypothetical protein